MSERAAPKRVLMVAPYARWVHHHETELELAEEHIRAGDRVTWLECRRDLPFCEPNPRHRLRECLTCAARASHGTSMLSGRPDMIHLPPLARERREWLRARLAGIRDLAGLRALEIDGFDLGLGTVSTLITVLEDPAPDLSEAPVRELATRVAEAALMMFDGLRGALAAGRYDVVYVLNGRFAVSRAAMSAAQSTGTRCIVHERGATPARYLLRENAMAHDLAQLRREIEDLWTSTGEPQARANADELYREQRRGSSRGWLPYIGLQKAGRLPQGWDSTRHNVVFFASSEDEYAALDGEWTWTLFPSQVDGIQDLKRRVGSDPQVRFWVRMHPNQQRLSQRNLRHWLDLAQEGIEVIPPASAVSTYALAEAANCVVSFGSTIGIEAAYWGKPSVLLGQALYRGLGSTYEPETVEQAAQWLAERSLPAKSDIGAVKYGNHLATFGRPFVHFESEGLFAGRFKGRRVRAGLVRRARIGLRWAAEAVRGRRRGAG